MSGAWPKLNEALNAAVNSDSPVEAYQILEQAVSDALGYCGNFRVCRDPDPLDPRDADNLTVLHLPNRSARYGDSGSKAPDEVEGVVMRRTIYFYQHGGPPIFSATPFNDRFDSGVAGEQYITKSQMDLLGITEPSPDALSASADEELAEYNQWLSGEAAWIVQVVGDDDLHAVTATDFDGLMAVFDHEALRSGPAAVDCLRVAWEQRHNNEVV